MQDREKCGGEKHIAFQKEYTVSHTPIEDLPKSFSSFDIRGGWGQAGDNLRCHLKNFSGRPWHRDDNVLKRINEEFEHVFLSAELTGRKLPYGRRREAGYSELLSFTWPAMV